MYKNSQGGMFYLCKIIDVKLIAWCISGERMCTILVNRLED